jgi:hypothetical protein
MSTRRSPPPPERRKSGVAVTKLTPPLWPVHFAKGGPSCPREGQGGGCYYDIDPTEVSVGVANEKHVLQDVAASRGLVGPPPTRDNAWDERVDDDDDAVAGDEVHVAVRLAARPHVPLELADAAG